MAALAVADIVMHPALYGVLSTPAVVALMIVLLAGPIAYATARRIRVHHAQIDPRLAMLELPPD